MREGIQLDFRAQVIGGAEQRYQDMLAGRTAPAIRTDLQVESSAAYESNWKRYVQRATAERTAFNNAIASVNKRAEERLAGENRHRSDLIADRSEFKGVIISVIILVVLMAAFVFACTALNLPEWVSNTLLPITGEHIKSVLDFENTDGIAMGILAVVAAIVGIVIFFRCIGDMGFIGSAIVATLACTAAAIVVKFVMFCVGYLVYFLLAPWGMMALAFLFCILILIVGRGLTTGRYKTYKWLCCVLCVALSIVTRYLVSIL